MKAVSVLYPDGQSAQQAVNRLRAAGLADREITVLSSQPLDDYEFGQMDKATWMWWIAGGPTFAWWPNLIIMFELTMLGAILATVKQVAPWRPITTTLTAWPFRRCALRCSNGVRSSIDQEFLPFLIDSSSANPIPSVDR